ncbi:ATP-grasp domain-containing protein [Paenibacillus sp. MMS20-IR301]|uniref:ATP-grasp domain-containing protein n=1 Tax=Paenibacillus sp. MMS20-IR301 TaxID=2895946 RepID=UPI0028EC5366|nr:ATP-grasp domain-containing protein [Paenibacillus sp. MMS20-IR301]WNS45924.1 ATP-grasp domain-containing protein [Paenibacillus sp. MMS20-IR301]
MITDPQRGGRSVQAGGAVRDGQAHRILITGGRAPVALELARLFYKGGHRVFVAESAKYHLCRVSSAVEASFRLPSPRHSPQDYIRRLAELIAELEIDCLIPTCEEIFYISAGLEVLNGNGCRVLASDLDMLRRLHHKGEFIAWVRSLGLPVPQTTLISSAAEWRQMTEDAAAKENQLVYKPAYSRFASKVILPQHGNDLQRSNGHRIPPAPPELSPDAPWVAQEYIRGKAICTYSIIHEGAVVAHAAYDSRYRTGQSGASVYFEHLEHPAVYSWIQRFAGAARGFSGQIGFDFIEAADGRLYPIECNPRATSGIHLFVPADGLEAALLNPGRLVQSGETVLPRSGRTAMLMFPMLGCGLKPGPAGFRGWYRAMRRAADVISRRDDRRPILEQLRIVCSAYKTAGRHGISLTEALTEDIEWNGEA